MASLSVSTVKPLADRVFVKVSASEEKTAGGLYLPTLLKKTTSRGSSCPGPGSATTTARQEMEIVGDKFSTLNTLARTSNWVRKNMSCSRKRHSLSFHSY